jgi:serine/threonine-protein kinase
VLVEARALRSNADDPLLGRILSEKYAIVGYIGQGGFGAVYRAVQEPIGQIVAVKVVRDAVRERANQLKRFAREARAVAALRHHNTVRLFDFGRDREQLFMVLEYINGRSLKQILRSEGALSPERAVRIIRQVAESLQEAHDVGVVHRDLKPANIMLTRSPFGDEVVKVLDFGLAKLLNDAVDNKLTAMGHTVGSPAYMAPEQINGTTRRQSDIYALGVVLFEALMGKKPFDARDRQRLIMAHLSAPVPQLKGVPPALAAVVHKAMAKRAEQRFEDGAEMAAALTAALATRANSADGYDWRPTTVMETVPDDEPTRTLSGEPPTRVLSADEPPTRLMYADESLLETPRRRLWPWLAAVGLLALGIGLGFALQPDPGPIQPTPLPDRRSNPLLPRSNAPQMPDAPPAGDGASKRNQASKSDG